MGDLGRRRPPVLAPQSLALLVLLLVISGGNVDAAGELKRVAGFETKLLAGDFEARSASRCTPARVALRVSV